MLPCVDTIAPFTCIGNKALKRIVYFVGHRSISIIYSDQDFNFGDTVIESKGMIELLLPRPEHIQYIPILIDVVDINIPTLLDLDVLDGKTYLLTA